MNTGFLRIVISALAMIFPWAVRRRLLNFLLDYEIDGAAHIGFSVVIPDKLVMRQGAKIGHLNFIRRQRLVLLEECAQIDHLNMIGGAGPISPYFNGQPRDPALFVRRHACITSRHLFDCTDTIEVGAFALVAGYGSHFLTHSPSLRLAVQECGPIQVGEYVFIGSGSLLLKGVRIAPYCVVSARSLIKRSLTQSYWYYEGVPATGIKPLDEKLGFFNRTTGRIP